MVGLRQAFPEIDYVRDELSSGVYFWINTYEDEPNYYTADEVKRLERIDPLFGINNVRHRSLDEPCIAGETSNSVNGEGDIRRCHFVPSSIGNIYDPDWKHVLMPRSCPNSTCGCYIGYINMPRLGHDVLFGKAILERIPHASAWRRQIEVDKV